MERFNLFKKKEQQTTQKEKNKEKEKSREYFGPNVIMEKFRKWGRIGAFVGVLFIGRGNVLAMQPESQQSMQTETAISQVEQSKEELDEIKKLEKELVSVFGEKKINEIKIGDGLARLLREQNIQIKDPEVTFAMQPDKMIDVMRLRRLWEDKNKNFFPKNWVAGEIFSINFAGPVGLNRTKYGNLFGFEKPEHNSDFTDIFIFPHEKFKNEPVDPELYTITLVHEFAHANDWLRDSTLNLKERFELLKKVYERLNSDDRYRDSNVLGQSLISAADKRLEYYEACNDGTQDGLYKSAREYWGQIAAAYFIKPKELLEKYPKDFALVDYVVKRGDPSFDVFKRDTQDIENFNQKIVISDFDEVKQDISASNIQL
jgi:hypothetical protein